LMVLLAEAYARFGEVQVVSNLFRGFIPAVVAIIVAVAWKMWKQSLTRPIHFMIAVCAFAIFLALGGFLTAIGLIVGAGGLGYVLFRTQVHEAQADEMGVASMNLRGPFILVLGLVALTVSLHYFGTGSMLAQLWARFTTMSIVMFGGGYVFIPMMQEVVVTQQNWMTAKEFAEAIALGQVTPGPIMISAAFIGYRAAALGGAAIATVAIFLPTALLMMILAGLHQKVRESAVVKAVYQGIRPCIVGLICCAAVAMARTADQSIVGIAIFLLSLVATVRFKLDTVYVVPAAGILGILGFA
jgi:chromate transporter